MEWIAKQILNINVNFWLINYIKNVFMHKLKSYKWWIIINLVFIISPKFLDHLNFLKQINLALKKLKKQL